MFRNISLGKEFAEIDPFATDLDPDPQLLSKHIPYPPFKQAIQNSPLKIELTTTGNTQSRAT